ncbi:hypothetical protein [Natronomonas marina]|jgi:hypothetical protein|uniref:hypothetical protein n=1 Tax=Natronomonas marina TaxID=2961939 RepID=UPI0020C9C1A0|nr:hypothetical protein [Natronomonas marina]
MEWTKPLSLSLSVLVAALAVGGAVELIRSTLGTGEYVAAAAGVLAFLAVVLLAAVAVGAKNGRWLSNPDSYW